MPFQTQYHCDCFKLVVQSDGNKKFAITLRAALTRVMAELYRHHSLTLFQTKNPYDCFKLLLQSDGNKNLAITLRAP